MIVVSDSSPLIALADVLKLELDVGEAEAIALAFESGADLVLLDERRGRQRQLLAF